MLSRLRIPRIGNQVAQTPLTWQERTTEQQHHGTSPTEPHARLLPRACCPSSLPPSNDPRHAGASRTGGHRCVSQPEMSRPLTVIIVASMVAMGFAPASVSATTSPAVTVSVRPGFVTRP